MNQKGSKMNWAQLLVLREGSGIKVGGTAGDALTISTYIKDAGNLPWQKGLPRLIYHRWALRNELLLRALTWTSFFTIRLAKTQQNLVASADHKVVGIGRGRAQ